MKQNNMMPLKKFAEANNISYRTAYRHWQKGLLEGIKLPTGTILVKGYAKDSSPKKDENSCILFIRAKTEPSIELVEKLKNTAHINNLEILDTIIWNGYNFQSNPYINKILLSGASFVIVNKLTDIYGINYLILESLLSEMGIKTITLDEPDKLEDNIRGLIKSSSSMAKAAVGMHGYKKELSHYINNILK